MKADTYVLSTDTQTINIENYQSEEYQDLIKKIKKVRYLNTLSTVFIWIFCIFPGLIFKIFVRTKLPVLLYYDIDDKGVQDYIKKCRQWMNLNRNDKFWQIISIKSNQNVTNNKFRDKIERIPIKSISQLPFYVKSNIPVCGLQLRDKHRKYRIHWRRDSPYRYKSFKVRMVQTK